MTTPQLANVPLEATPTPFSIIIITLNEAERIARLLQDLTEQTYRHFEVILVDSNSDDATCEIAKRFGHRLPKLSIHVMNKRGVALGRNTGASLAQFERLLFLDADVRLKRDFLAKADQLLTRKRLKVAGVYLNAKAMPHRFKLGYHLFNIGIFTTQFIFPTAIGACLFSSKSLHKRINGFDQSITLCEDCDYVNRAAKISRYRMLPMSFSFDPRRLRQDGYLKTGSKYLYANIYRLCIGEIRDERIDYKFGHYQSDN